MLNGKNKKIETQSFSLDKDDVTSVGLISNSTIETKKEPEPKVLKFKNK